MKKEVFALDLGNLQTKLKTRKTEDVLLSSFIRTEDLGSSLGLGRSNRDLNEYVSTLDDGVPYTWGKDMQKLRQTDKFTKTLSFRDRYQDIKYKLLADFALGYLGRAYEEARTEEGLDVLLVVGFPTEDFGKDAMLKEFSETMKGTHEVTIDGALHTINVDDIYSLAQPMGTIYDIVLKDSVDSEPDFEVLEEVIGVVDIGGGTILVDKIVDGNFSNDKKQVNEGAKTFYEQVRERFLKNHTESITVDDIAKAVRHGDLDNGYVYYVNKNTPVDITEEVKAQMTEYTKENVMEAIRLAYDNDFSTLDTLMVTGGGANFVDKEVIEEQFSPYNVVIKYAEDSEVTNVRGFYKYGVMMKALEEEAGSD